MMATVRATIKISVNAVGVGKDDLVQGVDDMIDAAGLTDYMESELYDYLPEESEVEEISIELTDSSVS